MTDHALSCPAPFSPIAGLRAPHRNPTAPEAPATAAEDLATAPEDRATGPEDRATGPEDLATAPEDPATAPEDPKAALTCGNCSSASKTGPRRSATDQASAAGGRQASGKGRSPRDRALRLAPRQPMPPHGPPATASRRRRKFRVRRELGGWPELSAGPNSPARLSSLAGLSSLPGPTRCWPTHSPVRTHGLA
jgi:hypothetical protein